MKSFHTIAVPHDDTLQGRLTLDVFAADLWEVYHGRSPAEYRDPDLFFRKTYLTQGLQHLLAVVEGRLNGRGGDPVIQIQTPFGGGKTHALIALYHLFAERDTWADAPPDAVSRAMEAAGVDGVPLARVVPFVGTASDPLAGKTPWGVLAEALGNYSFWSPTTGPAVRRARTSSTASSATSPPSS